MAKKPKKPVKAKPDPSARATLVSPEEATEYACVQGAVINSANLLQDAFFELFLVALSLERAYPAASGGTIRFRNQALGIWHSVRSDSAQRDMALSAILNLPTELKLEPALRRLQWIKDRLKPLTDGRNDLAHNPIIFHLAQKDPPRYVPVIGGLGTRPSSRQRYELLREIKIWQAIAHDLSIMSALVRSINIQIQRVELKSRDRHFRGRTRVSWPRKPRLQSPSPLKEISDLLSQRGERQSKPSTPPKRFWA